MEPLSTFKLPPPLNGLPKGYEWEERDMSAISTTTAFNAGVDSRDRFLGELRCIVCGHRRALVRYHVILDKYYVVSTELLDF